MPGGYGTRSTPWGSSGSSSGTTAPGQSGGYSGGSNQAAENINQARQDRQQAEQNWVNEFADVGVPEEVKKAYVPFESSVTGLQSNQPYTYKTKEQIEKDRAIYQSKTSMKEGVAGALGGLDYSWIYDEYGKPKGRSWDPFVKGYDPEGKPIKWTEDDIYDVFMGGEYYTGGPLRGQSGGGGGGGGWGGYGGYGGYGGGGGGGGGYGYGGEQQPPPRGYQRAGVGPGTLQEQVNQVFLGMSGMNQMPGIQKKRGGIVSLLRLGS